MGRRKTHQAASTAVSVEIPANTNLENYRLLGITAAKWANIKDECYYFLSLLVAQRQKKQVKDEVDEAGFIPLHSDYLSDIMGSTYKRAIDHLLLCELIQTDGEYVIGKKSMGYRLVSALPTYETRTVEITSAGVRNRLKEYRKKKAKEQVKLSKDIAFLEPFLTDGKLTIDMAGAQSMMEFWAKDLKTVIAEDGSGKQDKLTAGLYHRIDMLKTQLVRIKKEGFGRHKRDNTGFRLHSILTELKKEFRHFLSYDGKPLVAVDIKSSQYYFINVLLRQDFWEKNTGKINIAKILKGITNLTPTNIIHIIRIIKSLDNPISPASKGLYEIDFSSINWELGFYEMMEQHIKEFYADNKAVLGHYTKREKTKHALIITLFDDMEYGYENYSKPLFECFPELGKLIQYLHGLTVGFSGKKWLKNNLLPILLQRIESVCVMEHVALEINKDHPDIPLFSIHDSLMTTEGNEGKVAEYMDRILTQLVGVKPGLKTEYMNAAEAQNDYQKLLSKDYDKMGKKRKKGSAPLIPVAEVQARLKALDNTAIAYSIPTFMGRKIFSTKYVDDGIRFDDYMECGVARV